MKQGNAVPGQAGPDDATATQLRAPLATDGSRVWDLIQATPALDANSLYANLLQCSDFAETCAVAERDGQLVGWMSGYRPPSQPDTLFVWQICVSAAARGQGLGQRLVAEVLARPANQSIRQVTCTITEANAASWALFGAIARAFDAPLERTERFAGDAHFAGRHDSEFAVTIGPIHRDRAASLAAA